MKANYSYLSDGTKTKTLNASSVGYDYAGSFTYSHASNGAKTLESVAFGGGRIRKSGSTYAVDYHITDHLGSVRAIVNASGTVVEQNDYYPFGMRHPNGLTQLSANRWRFSGKEEQDAAFGIAYSDFGARFYDRTAWTSIDLMAEKYYEVSPYAYCNNNPVNAIDIEGRFPFASNLIGALAAAGVEYAAQVAGNIIGSKNFSWDAFTDIDLHDIVIAAGEGFLSSGSSIIKKTATKVALSAGAEILNNTVDIKPKEGYLDTEVNSYAEVTEATAISLMFSIIPGPSPSSTIKKSSVNKQVETLKAAAREEGRSVSSKEARQMGRNAKAKNQKIDLMNQAIKEEAEESVGHFLGTSVNQYLWNGKEKE